MNPENPKDYRPSDEEIAAYYGRPVPFKQMVYDLMNGDLNIEEYPLAVSKYIPSEFYEGSECSKLYDELYSTRLKIEEKYGTKVDDDVSIIIDRCFSISELLCMKMFDYGAMFGK